MGEGDVDHWTEMKSGVQDINAIVHAGRGNEAPPTNLAQSIDVMSLK